MSKPDAWIQRLLGWYRLHKRDLPWRNTRDPYAVWISEIMLQQTRVETVKEYYRRFLTRFPDAASLANAPEAEVLKLWEGLGYYSRARNLQKAAMEVTAQYGGKLPADDQALLRLPGIGAYTAGAIASIAFNLPVPAVDGNVKRVAARFFGERESMDNADVQKRIVARLHRAVPEADPGTFNQALMELGATLCMPRAPQCEECPLQSDCDAYAEGDAETLPVHEKKRPAVTVDMAVCIVTDREGILLFKRTQRLLNGLYVFALIQDESDPQQITEQLREEGLQTEYRAALGEANHVFTHRIWRMKIYHYQLLKRPDQAWLLAHGAILADARQLDALPLPTAMKAAKAEAIKLLAINGGGITQP